MVGANQSIDAGDRTKSDAMIWGKSLDASNWLAYLAGSVLIASSDNFGKLELELRRGVVVLATLSQLRKPR